MKGAEIPSLCLLFLSTMDSAIGDKFPPFSMSDWDLQRAGGYYSSEGRYQGGMPRIGEQTLGSSCIDFVTPTPGESPQNYTVSNVDNGNATVCWRWEESKESPVDTEIDLCTCQELAPSVKYCLSWSCSRVKADTSIQCGNNCYYEVHGNFRECLCEIGIRSGEFCAVWNCFDTDVTRISKEYEEYKCVRDSAQGRYCEAWTGEVDTDSRAKTISCACDDREDWIGDGVCSSWECKERSIKKCLGGCNFSLAVGLGGTLGLLGIYFLYNAIRAGVAVSMGLASTWLVASAGCVLFWGGIDGAVFAGCMWGIGIILCVMIFVCKRKEGS